MEALAGRPIVHNSTRFSSTPRVANIPRYALHVHNALRRNQALSDPHLCPKPHFFAQITAADTTYLKKYDGHLRIINDIGLSNVYKTIAVSPTAFRGNEYIEWVDFTDLSYEPRANNYTEIGILLPDSAFAGCKNLKHIDLVQYVTVGVPNHYVALSPKQVIVGEHAFDGCHENFEIRVTGEMYPLFINDPNWAKYRNRIVIFEYTPDGNDNSYTVKGVTYSQRNSLHTLGTILQQKSSSLPHWQQIGICSSPISFSTPQKACQHSRRC